MGEWVGTLVCLALACQMPVPLATLGDEENFWKGVSEGPLMFVRCELSVTV